MTETTNPPGCARCGGALIPGLNTDFCSLACEEAFAPAAKTAWACRCRPRCSSLSECHAPQPVRPEEA